ADACLFRSYLVDDLDVFRQSDSATQRAFEVDRKAPETNVALGIIREVKLDWTGAEQLFRSAIELNPKHWNAYRELGLLHWRMGRFEEAEKEALLSLDLEPLAAQTYGLLGSIYSSLGKHTLAAEKFKKGSEIDFPYNGESLGWEYLTLGQNEKARDIFIKGKSPMIACYYAAIGRKKDALKEIDTVRTKLKDLERPYYLAIIYSCLGENGKALDQLEVYLRMHPYIPWFQVDPFLSKLYSEPRFIAMVKKLGIDK
ncbi:MAG: tetratricopeptide repeat protein, partial [Ignavibacteria bacterium]|nr:tetratricopeptide repeat protein [Ignavibacteria bacterium]